MLSYRVSDNVQGFHFYSLYVFPGFPDNIQVSIFQFLYVIIQGFPFLYIGFTFL
jgi:hypothetical protein